MTTRRDTVKQQIQKMVDRETHAWNDRDAEALTGKKGLARGTRRWIMSGNLFTTPGSSTMKADRAPDIAREERAA